MRKKRAARVDDATSHGGKIKSGSPNVFINNRPAANAASAHTCPRTTKTNPPVPHVGGPAIPPTNATVFVNGLPIICRGDEFVCVAPKPAKVRSGSPNVIVG